MNYVGCTIPNINRYFFRCGITLCYRQAYDGTTTVDVALRVVSKPSRPWSIEWL